MTLDEAQIMLKQIEAELSPKEMKRSIKGALLKEARRVRRVASGYLRKASVFKGGRKLHNASIVAKNIRAKVFKDFGGFIVAANPYGKVGYHRNRKGLEKPVLMWVNGGTAMRTRAGAKGSNGAMPSVDFIGQAERTALPGSIKNIVVNYQSNVLRVIRRHGGN